MCKTELERPSEIKIKKKPNWLHLHNKSISTVEEENLYL